jgi:hypothetical protein
LPEEPKWRERGGDPMPTALTDGLVRIGRRVTSGIDTIL